MTKFGFTLLRTQDLPEIDGKLHELRHEKTGARLCWLQRPDDNKTFGVAFTTLPEDSTGVFHILEHSVLCGSKRYPVKEPFVELLKNSMNTFLNAMTFSDKTFYPISSRNEKDFLNLMRVYLDAVFFPRIYTKPEIFYQEGWHYEFDENGRPGYKGVVFNEMKGAYASADEHLQETMDAALFPDTCYRFSSGGDPACIPSLRYEQFLDAHRRFYSPSNSFLFLDGALDLDRVLAIIDGEYLSALERGACIAPPAIQSPVNAGVKTISYELGAEEAPEKRYRTGWGNVIGSFADKKTLLAMQVLAATLCGSNQAPLSRCILEKELAENVSMQIMDGVSQPWVLLDVENFARADLPEIEQTIRAELERLSGGLDHEELIAQMANLEFKLREADFGSMPRGLVYGIRALESWLYGGDPALHIVVGDVFEQLREEVGKNYFEELVRRILLENTHTCQVILEPSHSLGEKRRQEEQARLAQAAAAWTPEQKQTLQAQYTALQQWQERADTPEELATLPALTLADIAPEPERIPAECVTLGGLPVLLHRVSCGGIVYVNLYFDIADRREEELPVVSFLSGLLGEVATQNTSARELMRRRQLLCGELQCTVRSFPKENEPLVCERKLCVSFSTLEGKLQQALELVAEILTETTFAEEDSVREVLRQWKTMQMQNIVMSGATVAMARVSAQTSASGVSADCTGGLQFYRWMKEQERAWNWKALQQALRRLREEIFCTKRLFVSVTGQMEDAARIVTDGLCRTLPAGEQGAAVALHPWGKRKEGIAIPADISFAVRGGSLLDAGGAYDGAMPLAGRMISYAYLWNVIRVQGGAYGTGMRAQSTGLVNCYSYRDPNAARSLQQYLGAADFLRGVCQSGEDLTGFIIGAVAEASPLLTPKMQGLTGDTQYWAGVNYETLCRRRAALLACTHEDLLREADLLEAVLRDGGICVIGSQGQLDACALDEILPL